MTNGKKITFKYNDLEITVNKKNGKVNVKNNAEEIVENNDNAKFDSGLISVFKSIVRVDKLNDLQTIFKNTGENKSNTLVIDEADMKFLMQFTEPGQTTDQFIAGKIDEEITNITNKNSQNVMISTEVTDGTTIEAGATTTADATATETIAEETIAEETTTADATATETTTVSVIATETIAEEMTTADATATETTTVSVTATETIAEETTTADATATETTTVSVTATETIAEEITTASATATQTTTTEEILAGNNAIAKLREEICDDGYSITSENSNGWTVKSGDNLWKIAKAVLKEENDDNDPTNKEIMYRCAQIACWNKRDDDFIIHPGDKLIVSAPSNAGNTGDETLPKTDGEAAEKATLAIASTNAEENVTDTIPEEIKTSNNQKELDIEVDKAKQNDNVSSPFADGNVKAKEIYDLVKGVNYNFYETLKNKLKKRDYITTENVEYIVEYWKRYSKKEGIIEALTKEYDINVSEMEIIPKKLIERAESEGLSGERYSNLYYLKEAVGKYDNDSKYSNDYKIKDAKKIDQYMNEVLKELKQKRK